MASTAPEGVTTVYKYSVHKREYLSAEIIKKTWGIMICMKRVQTILLTYLLSIGFYKAQRVPCLLSEFYKVEETKQCSRKISSQEAIKPFIAQKLMQIKKPANAVLLCLIYSLLKVYNHPEDDYRNVCAFLKYT